MTGRFITFEGSDGSGKSKQARMLADELDRRGHDVVLTREPGGTAAAEAIRAVLLDPATKLAPMAEILLHFAARADHVERVIRPALARGQWVVCDRYFDSTMAYQGFGMHGDAGLIWDLQKHMALFPDLTLVLDVSVETARARIGERKLDDRYERLPLMFKEKVRSGFKAIAIQNRHRCVLIDAERSVADVHREVLRHVAERIGDVKIEEPLDGCVP